MNFDKKIKKMLGIKSNNIDKSLNNLFSNKQKPFNINKNLFSNKQKPFNINKNLFSNKQKPFNNQKLIFLDNQKLFKIKNNWNFDNKKRILRQDNKVRYKYPHWLVNQLNKEQQLEAEKMLLEQGYNAGQVAEHFGVDNPFINIYRKSPIFFTDEQLINVLQQIGRDKGRTPIMKDLNDYTGYPTYIAFVGHFGSWNEALKIAGFETKEHFKYKKMKTKDQLIYSLQQLAQELGRTPTGEDVDNRPDLPTNMTFRLHFGSWNNALKEAGLTLTKRTDYTKEELIQILQQFAQELGRTPTGEDIDNQPDLPSSMTYINYFGSWNNALKESKLEIIQRKDYTKEELIQILQEFAQKLGRSPVFRDLKESLDLPSADTFRIHFGSWNNALKEAGLTITKRFDYTKEELIKILQKFAQELGRNPTSYELVNRSDLPSHQVFKTKFGTWNNTLKEAGLK